MHKCAVTVLCLLFLTAGIARERYRTEVVEGYWDPNAKLYIYEYPSLDNAVAAYYEGAEHKSHYTDATESKVGHTQEELVAFLIEAGVKKIGVWGFSRQFCEGGGECSPATQKVVRKEIHYWCRPSVKLEMLIHFFSHELGHLEPIYPPMENDEPRGISYSNVALLAVHLAEKEKRQGLNICTTQRYQLEKMIRGVP